LPSGGTVLKAGDTLLVLSEQESFERVARQASPQDKSGSRDGLEGEPEAGFMQKG